MKFDHTSSYFYKYSNESFDIRYDFTDSLASGETLSSCTVVITDSLGVDTTSAMIDNESTSSPYHDFTIQAGTAGETYQIVLTGTSDGGLLYSGTINCEVYGTITLNANLGDPSANSYVTLQEANNYIRNVRGHSSTWDLLSVEGKKRLLIEAARDVDRLNFIGEKYYDFQALEFPRDDHEKVQGTCASPITIISFANTNLSRTTYGKTRSNDDSWKYGSVHITNGTPLNDIRMINTSVVSTDVITMVTNFTATPNTSTSFIAFEPLDKEIKDAQCEQALFIIDNTSSDELTAYGLIANEVEIGDVRVKFNDGMSDKKTGHSPSAKHLLSKWINRILRVYRS